MTRQREAVLDDFRDAVREYPHLVWHHCLHSTRCEGSPGLADLIIIGPGGILFRECKPHPGAHPSPAQIAWKYAILGAGGDWALWTPQDVTSGQMGEDLRRVAAVAHVVLERLGDPIRPEGRGAFDLSGLPDYVAGSDAWWRSWRLTHPDAI